MMKIQAPYMVPGAVYYDTIIGDHFQVASIYAGLPSIYYDDSPEWTDAMKARRVAYIVERGDGPVFFGYHDTVEQ